MTIVMMMTIAMMITIVKVMMKVMLMTTMRVLAVCECLCWREVVWGGTGFGSLGAAVEVEVIR